MPYGNSISHYNSICPKVIIQISICKIAVHCSTLYFFLFCFFVTSNTFSVYIGKKKTLTQKFAVDFLNKIVCPRREKISLGPFLIIHVN